MVYSNNGILYNNKNELTCYNIQHKWVQEAHILTPNKKVQTVWFNLHTSFKIWQKESIALDEWLLERSMKGTFGVLLIFSFRLWVPVPWVCLTLRKLTELHLWFVYFSVWRPYLTKNIKIFYTKHLTCKLTDHHFSSKIFGYSSDFCS